MHRARAVRVDGSRARQAVAVRVQAPRAPGRSARVLCIVLGAPRRLGGRDVVLDARRAHLEAAHAAGVRAHLGLAVVARAVLLAPRRRRAPGEEARLVRHDGAAVGALGARDDRPVGAAHDAEHFFGGGGELRRLPDT